MPGRVGQVTPTSVKRRKGRRKPPKVSVPYAPTRKGKEAEEKARGPIQAPYAPTPTGKAAERRAAGERRAKRKSQALKATRKARRQNARKAHRIEQRALKTLRKPPPTPAGAVQEARQGVKPPESKSWRKAFPEAAKQADKAFTEHVGSKEGVKPDPLAEFVISTAATAGVGAAAKGAATLAKSALAARAGSKLASTGVTAAEKAVETGAKGVAARTASKAGTVARAGAKRIKTAPKRTARRIKETPGRVKTAPKRAKVAVSTKAGRRAARKSATRKARRHPVRTGYGAAAVSPVPLPGEADKRARAFAQGTAAALTRPGKVAKTTGQGVLGFLGASLAVGGAAFESAKKGSTEPLRHEIRDLAYVPADKTGTGREGGIVGMTKSLASGDPKLVEETTLEESGLVPFIPAPAIIRRAKRTKAYGEARGAVRGKVEARRAKTRGKRVAAEKAATESGEFVSRRKARKVRQPVAVRDADLRPTGESYVLRRTGRQIEKQRSRHRLSREVTRMEEEGRIAGKKESEAVAKPLRKSKGTDQRAQNDGEALRIFVNHGLPEDKAAAMAYVNMLHENWPKIERGEVPPAGVHLDRHSTKYILDHPEIFEGKRGQRFFESVREFNRQSQAVGTSKRNQYLAQVNNVINPIRRREGKEPILKPEEMPGQAALAVLPKRQGRPVNGGLPPTRSQLRELQAARAMERRGLAAPAEPALQLAKAEKQWTRSEAFSYLAELRQIKGPDKPKAQAQAKALSEALDGLMKPPEHGGAQGGVSTTRAVSWTPEMEREFVGQVRAEHPRLNLRDPAAYVADVAPSGLKGGDKAPNFAAELPVRNVWPSQGKVSVSGNALSDFESLVYHSIEAPRARAAAVRGLNRIFDAASRKVEGRRYLTRRQAENAVATRQVPDGTIFVRTQALKSVLEGEHVLDADGFRRMLEGEVEQGQILAAAGELAGEMKAAKAAGVKGEKFAPMDAVAMHELIGHLKGPGDISRAMGHASNFATRTILNSPGFEAAQFAQEGIPMAMALGRDVVKVPKAIAAITEIAKLDAETQAAIRAVVGSSVGTLGAPKIRPWRAAGFMDPVRAAGPKRLWRHAWEVVNGDKLSRFDRARAGRFREAAALAKVEGDLRRAEGGFQRWRSGANNLFRDMDGAIKDMKGMNRAERLAYVAEHPVLGDRLMRSMSQMAGNWNSFTVFEKNISPFAVFYPFQRYSALWVLYHFPLDHPAVATSLAALGEVNAQELQRLAATEGATPGVLDYAKPVVNGRVLPAGQRFSAVLGSLQQAVLGGKPTQVLSGLSPALGIPLEAISGKNSFTGAPLGMSGWEYLARQSLNLSPLLRFVGVPDVGEEKSVASKAFGQYDKDRAKRSFLNPYSGQSGEDFAKEKKLEGGFERKYGKGREYKSNLAPEVWEAAFNGDWKAAKKLRKARLESEAGAEVVKKAEEPFFEDAGKDLSEEGSKILQYITGQRVFPAEEETAEPGGAFNNVFGGGKRAGSGSAYQQVFGR